MAAYYNGNKTNQADGSGQGNRVQIRSQNMLYSVLFLKKLISRKNYWFGANISNLINNFRFI